MSYGEIAAWAALSGRQPAPWQVAALLAVDAVRRRALAEISGEDEHGIP